MARPLRIEFPGACYHVICRGNQRFPVFGGEEDRVLLLDRFKKFADAYGVSVRCYCLMVNHCHLYLQTEEGNLGRFMHSFLTSFTISYNRRHGTSGHVFQGRYKAFLVEEDAAYAARVSRYIHLNPVCTRAFAEAALDVRKEELRQFRWSSYAATIGLRRCPAWLDRKAVLRSWGKTIKEREGAYARYVEQGLTEESWNPWEAAAAQAVIGSDSFVDRVRRGLTDLAANLNIRTESRQQRALRAYCSLEQVKQMVADAYGCEVLRRHARGNEARQALLYLAATFCRGRYTLAELGRRLGPITTAAVSRARSIMVARMARDRELRGRIAKMEDRLRTDKCTF